MLCGISREVGSGRVWVFYKIKRGNDNLDKKVYEIIRVYMFGIKTKLIRWVLRDYPLVREDKIRDLMRFFKSDDDGHQASVERADLGYGWWHYGIIRQQKPKRVLCIGSRHGFIPAVLAQACKDNLFGHVDFVDAGYGTNDLDHWTGEGYWKTKQGKFCFKNFNIDKYITSYIMTTEQFISKYKSRLYDYVYIDGDHSIEGVTFDFDNFWPRLRKGGFMAFHDACVKGHHEEGDYGVWRLWLKLRGKNCFTIHHVESGLGIIQKIR